MCESMVDIQSATAEIKRVKKKKKQDTNIMSVSATQGGHKYLVVLSDFYIEKFFDRICRVPLWRNREVRSDVTTVLKSVNEQRNFSFI